MPRFSKFKIDKILLALVFCIALTAPLLVGIIQADQAKSTVEQRNLAAWPAAPQSIEAVSAYPKAFNAYYSDHFGFREVLTRGYFKLLNVLGWKTSDEVVLGRDGWLFLGSIKPGKRGNFDPIGDAMHVNLYTLEQLENFAASIQSVKNWLANRGVAYLYVLAPNKHTIYSEYLPAYIDTKNSKSAADQLLQYLEANTDVTVLDLRQALRSAKKQQQLYFKTDTHWNSYGANVAQYEILKKVQAFFPGEIEPKLLGENEFKETQSQGGDLARMTKLENISERKPFPIFKHSCHPENSNENMKPRETHTLTCKRQGLNAVIFRDSFFSALKGYIARQFQRSTYIWEPINTASLIKYVEQEKPDIVIEEVVERTLPYVPKIDFDTESPAH